MPDIGGADFSSMPLRNLAGINFTDIERSSTRFRRSSEVSKPQGVKKWILS